jgi:hypothetical protein
MTAFAWSQGGEAGRALVGQQCHGIVRGLTGYNADIAALRNLQIREGS